MKNDKEGNFLIITDGDSINVNMFIKPGSVENSNKNGDGYEDNSRGFRGGHDNYRGGNDNYRGNQGGYRGRGNRGRGY